MKDPADGGGRNDHGTQTYVDDPDVGRADHDQGGGYLYARNRLLATAGHADDVIGNLRRFKRRSQPEKSAKPTSSGDDFGQPKPLFKGSNIVSIPLKESGLVMSVPEIVSTMRSEDRTGGPVQVAPDHVLVLGSHPWPFPANAPRRGDRATLHALGEGPTAGIQVVVALFDSGIDSSNRILSGHVEAGTGPGDAEDAPSNPLGRYAAHGTFNAGLILQSAPGATIAARKAFGAGGHVTDSGLGQLLRTRMPKGVQIVVLPLGGPTHDGIGLPATREALDNLRAENPSVAVVAAAGNDAVTDHYFPAAFDDVIGVAAVTSKKKPACFSNFGDWVDACAVGVDLKSTYLVATAHVDPVEPAPGCPHPGPARTENFDGWAIWSGTSFATARVAGAIAAKMTELGLDPVAAAASLLNGQPKVADGTRNFGVFVDAPPLRFS